jgi:hypothetical protein
MKPSRPVWAAVAGAVTLLFALTLWLPWADPELRVGLPIRLAMLASGVAVLLFAAARPRGATRGVVPAVGVLGATTAAYPSLLALAAAGVGGPVVALTAAGWHTVPLTLVQLVPVMARTRVIRGRGRRWEAAILVVAVVGAGLVALVLSGVPAAEPPSLVLWFGSFLLAPVATLERRRRADGGDAAAGDPRGGGRDVPGRDHRVVHGVGPARHGCRGG